MKYGKGSHFAEMTYAFNVLGTLSTYSRYMLIMRISVYHFNLSFASVKHISGVLPKKLTVLMK